MKLKWAGLTFCFVSGAVWSLDGKTQIDDKVSCKLKFNVNDNDEESPRKKLKTSHDESKQPSPKVIDEPSTSGLGDGHAFTVKKLIDIHGDLFKKCPFADKMTEKVKNDDILADFPIGQEVMGSCPYLTTEAQKVDALSLDLKCPISGMEATTATETSEKCPFIAEQHKSQAESVEVVEDANGNGVKMVDYNEKKIEKVPELVDHSDILYCGMFRHKSVASKLFEDAECLGRQLAENLIKLGALDVMRVAQNFIRQKA